MGVLLDDDFSSYAVGQHPPYGNLENANIASVPDITDSIFGVFNDAQSVHLPGAQLQYPILPPISLPEALAGVTYPGLGVPAYNQFSVFEGFKILNNSDQQGTIMNFDWALHSFAGVRVCSIFVRSDGCIGIQGDGPILVSDFSMLCEKWYWLQVNIACFTSISGHVGFTAEVGVNNISVVSGLFQTTIPIANYEGWPLYMNNIVLGGAGQGAYLGRLTICDDMRAIGDNPHPGSPVAKVSQGVIELVQAFDGFGPISYAHSWKAGHGLSHT